MQVLDRHLKVAHPPLHFGRLGPGPSPLDHGSPYFPLPALQHPLKLLGLFSPPGLGQLSDLIPQLPQFGLGLRRHGGSPLPSLALSLNPIGFNSQFAHLALKVSRCLSAPALPQGLALAFEVGRSFP